MGRSLFRAVIGLGLTTGPLHTVLIAGAIAGLLVLALLRRDRSWWLRQVPGALAATTVLLVVTWQWIDAVKSWPDALPPEVWAWTGAGELAVVLAAVGWRRRSARLRILSLGAALLALVGAADGINTVYDAYPTVATALQLPPQDSAAGRLSDVTALNSGRFAPSDQALWHWRSSAALPAHGTVFSVAIPATHSHFTARPAWVYVPPAYLAPNAPRLPLLMLLPGQPGGPRDWLDGGKLATRMDAYAAAHSGLAPVVVMPDNSGSEFANPLCMDSALGKVDTYLTEDVLPWAITALHLDPDPRHTAVGGFSAGGTCALQLATAHPGLFSTFFDASGQEGPTLGSRRQTVAATFKGDNAAFQAVDPLAELARNRYPDSAGYFVVGADDHYFRAQQRVVVRAARASGMTTVAVESPGQHDFRLWGPALSTALPWLTHRMGLSP
jgi:S-formylglutathione hydrolase FrmB